MLADLGDQMTKWLVTVVRIWGCFVLATSPLSAQGAPGGKAVNRVILDTDIGDDIDPALLDPQFAGAFALLGSVENWIYHSSDPVPARAK